MGKCTEDEWHWNCPEDWSDKEEHHDREEHHSDDEEPDSEEEDIGVWEEDNGDEPQAADDDIIDEPIDPFGLWTSVFWLEKLNGYILMTKRSVPVVVGGGGQTVLDNFALQKTKKNRFWGWICLVSSSQVPYYWL